MWSWIHTPVGRRGMRVLTLRSVHLYLFGRSLASMNPITLAAGGRDLLVDRCRWQPGEGDR